MNIFFKKPSFMLCVVFIFLLLLHIILLITNIFHMKRNMLCCFLSFFSLLCSAQEFDIGVKGGLSYVNLRGTTSDVSTFKGKLGVYVGAYGELFLGRIFSLQPEVLFSRQGARWEREGLLPNGELYKASINTDYINVPILTSLKLHEKFSLQVGGQFGFLAVKPEIGSEEPIFYNGENFLDKGIYKNFDFAVIIGCKVRLMEDLAAELRYVNSLTNLFDKQHPALITTEFGNNNVFRHSYLSIGVEYRLKQLTIF